MFWKFWKRQNRRDREILAAMMLCGHRPRALEISSTAHWCLLPNATTNAYGKVYACCDGSAIILAHNDGERWNIDVRYTNI